MATLVKRKSGKSEFWMIQFYDEKKKRKYVSLSVVKYKEKTAIELKEIVETLLYNRNNAIESPSKKTQHWVLSASPEIQDKLAKVGLINTIQSHTCIEMWDNFLMEKEKEIKSSTYESYEACKERFFRFFKEKDLIEELTPEIMLEFKKSLRMSLAEATVCGTITKLRTIFNWALALKWITKSPMAGVSRGSFVNRKNDRTITRDEYFRLLDNCPCQEWRVILALVRYGGLRCPSEVLRLRWRDVNWAENLFHVASPKTEHHEGQEERIVPLFPEVRQQLEELFFRDETEGTEFVINRYRDAQRTNLGTQFARIVKMAGMAPIKRPFDNMRANRCSEINARFGSFFEMRWMGHSTKIARKHYLDILPEDISRAAEWTTGGSARSPEAESPPSNRPIPRPQESPIEDVEPSEKGAG